MAKLAIIVSHPIQYYAPLFATMSKELDLKVFYGFQPNAQQQGAAGFGKAFKWDVDLLSGYVYEFLDNRAKAPSSAYYKGCDTPAIGERIRNYGASHVVTFGWHLKMYRQALHYCKKNKIPIAVRGDSQLNPQLPLWKKVIKKLYYPSFLRKYDAFLSVGKRNRDYLKHFGVPDQRIIFSPHAVDQVFWKNDGIKRAESSFTFIWVGKFIGLKRPMDVIQAFKELSAKIQSIKLLMIGTGVLYEGCISKASDASNISFLGFKNQIELKKYYTETDCLILSSDSETWGLVVNEGFAAGIPAIVSEACGCGPDLINEWTGVSYKTGDVHELEKAMYFLYNRLDSPDERAKIVEAIKCKNEVYSYNTIIKSFKIFLSQF